MLLASGALTELDLPGMCAEGPYGITGTWADLPLGWAAFGLANTLHTTACFLPASPNRSLWLTARKIPAMRVAGPLAINVKGATQEVFSLFSFSGPLRASFMFTLTFPTGL